MTDAPTPKRPGRPPGSKDAFRRIRRQPVAHTVATVIALTDADQNLNEIAPLGRRVDKLGLYRGMQARIIARLDREIDDQGPDAIDRRNNLKDVLEMLHRAEIAITRYAHEGALDISPNAVNPPATRNGRPIDLAAFRTRPDV